MHYPERIVIVNGSPLPSVGGIQTFSEALAKFSNAAGIETIFIATSKKDRFIGRFAGCLIFRLRSIPLLDGRLPIPVVLTQLFFLMAWLRKSKLTTLLVIQGRFYPTSLFFCYIGRLSRSRVIVVDHGADHLTLGNRFFDMLSAGYEHVITWLEAASRPAFYGVSESSTEWLEHFGLMNAQVVYNGISLDQIDAAKNKAHTTSRRFKIAFCGRLIKQKGVHVLIEAFAKLDSLKPGKYEMVIIGSGPMLQSLQHQAISYPAISFTGALKHSDALEELCTASVVISPSLWPEGFCRTALEAGALEIPLVVSRHGGGKTLVEHNRTGFVLDHTDSDKIASAVEQTASDYNTARGMAANLRKEIAGRYTWDRILHVFLSESMQDR